ncbi:MAG TPA: PadR family transcriptional regulator [Gaiellaceae bacterium]
MPIHHAVLALLEEGESYGYELRAQFKEAVGPQWGDLNIGHLYQVLDRLVRDGLVTKRAVAQSARPAKLVYRLTKAGRKELERWLETPYVRPGGYRDDFFLKLLAASRLGPGALESTLRVQRQAFLGELASLTELRQHHRAEPLVALLIEAAILHTQANLRVVELAGQAPNELVEERTDDARGRGEEESSAAGA